MTSRPSTFPDWATGGTADKEEPTSAIRASGWVRNVPPLAQWENWDRYLIAQWLRYSDERRLQQFVSLETAIDETDAGKAAVVCESYPGAPLLSQIHISESPAIGDVGTAVYSNGQLVVWGFDDGTIQVTDRAGDIQWSASINPAVVVGSVAVDGVYVAAAAGNVLKLFAIDGTLLDTYTFTGGVVVNKLMLSGDYLFAAHDYDAGLASSISAFTSLPNINVGPALTDSWAGAGGSVYDMVTDGYIVWAVGTADGANIILRSYSWVALGVLYSWAHPAGAYDGLCIAHDDKRIYVGVEANGGSVTIYALPKMAAVSSVDHWALATPWAWLYDNGVARLIRGLSCDGTYVYAIYTYSGGADFSLTMLAADTGNQVASVPVDPAGIQPFDIHADGFQVWVAHAAGVGDKYAMSVYILKHPPRLVYRHAANARNRLYSQLATVWG